MVTASIAVLLLAGLVVSGVWQFLFHDPDWDNYTVGGSRPVLDEPIGMADVHRALSDLAAVFALWITIWLSYRVLNRIAWIGVWGMAVVATGILTGSRIRINAVVRDGAVDPDASGYAQLYAGNYDYVIADTNEFEPVSAIAWTTLHVASVPVLLATIWFVLYRSRLRQRNAPTPDPSWLDRMGA